MQDSNKKCKVLVLAAYYPTVDGARPLYYIHSRNLYYQANNIDVTVLNFSVKKGYIFDGIKIISLAEFDKKEADKYNILILHAANIRNHYKFLVQYGSLFEKKIFVFHGHEILHISKYYPAPYDFMVKKSVINGFLQDRYDDLKIAIWRRYFLKNIHNVRLIFVSKWIYKQFLRELNVREKRLMNNAKIISNSIGKIFEEMERKTDNIVFDFLTIRSNMDDSKYGVDIVIKLAETYPNYKFCLIGKGNIFNYLKKPENLFWISKEMTHEEIVQYINKSRIALVPTREDTQGLIACEMASCGMPLITSDIEVCREVFSDCPRCAFINNDEPDLEKALRMLSKDTKENKAWQRYYARNTIIKEIEFIKKYFYLEKGTDGRV